MIRAALTRLRLAAFRLKAKRLRARYEAQRRTYRARHPLWSAQSDNSFEGDNR